MFSLAPLEPINYLIIGHLTYDLTPAGPRIGGTAAYAGLTAHALGLRVGIVTSWGGELPLGNLKHIPIISYPAEHSTTFENIYTDKGRIQIVHTVAPQPGLSPHPRTLEASPNCTSWSGRPGG